VPSLNIQTTFVYTHYTLVPASFILNNNTLINIVILVFLSKHKQSRDNYHAIVEYAEIIAPSGDHQ